MHAVVQDASVRWFDGLGRPALVRTAADAIAATWPDLDGDAALAQALRANVAALLANGPEALWEPDAHEVLFRVGRSLGEASLVAEAVGYFRALAETAARVLGTDDAGTLATRAALASWQANQRQARD